MLDFQVIDVHMHTHRTSAIGIQAMGGQPQVPGYTGIIEELLPLMEREGITHVCMVNFTPVFDMLEAAYRKIQPGLSPADRQQREEEIRRDMVGRVQRRNDWTCGVSREHRNLLGFIGVDPVMDQDMMYEEVVRCHRNGASGIKLHTAVQRLPLNDRRLWSVYRAAEERGITVLAHTGPFQGLGAEETRPGFAAEVLRDFPRLKMILAHCGGRPYYQEAIELAKMFPQVTFDCCGVVTGNSDPEELSDEDLVGLFRSLGTHRVMFGSDWPWQDPVQDIQRLQRLPLTDDEKVAILSGNAQRMLEL